ncbi:MAG: hypothetical protein O2901_16065 [Verrucomicrobia bacterium]|nr:hypothetical protein [Verrucomicrobiota bacterium]
MAGFAYFGSRILSGLAALRLRGTEKVSGEWELVTLAYHMKRLWNLKLAAG